MTSPYPDGSLREIAEQLRSGQLSATELTERALARHAASGEKLHAYKYFDPEGARQSARAAHHRARHTAAH